MRRAGQWQALRGAQQQQSRQQRLAQPLTPDNGLAGVQRKQRVKQGGRGNAQRVATPD